MRVDVAIARGDPQAPGAGGANWTVAPVALVVVFPFEARWRLSWLFGFIERLDINHDDILIFMTDANLSATLIDRVRELRNKTIPRQKVCLLDNGLLLANLTANQIIARVG